jgi:proline iminopeptidase
VQGRYPETVPYDHGMLDVGDGNLVYWETCGNRDGKPALVLHGGPGSGCTPAARRNFDPNVYRTVLFDQRNCGRSTPHASQPDIDLTTNTTDHLIADMERLRQHLNIDRWLVTGASWGCALALAYAQRHPERVTELVVLGVATGNRQETNLLTRSLGGIFPAAWARFREGVPEADRDGDLSDAYHRLVMNPDPEVHERAARSWCDWEIAIQPTSPPHPRYDDARFRLAFSRIVTHYWRHGSWLEDTVLQGMHRLSDLPGAIVQGSLDLSNLLGTPWRLAQAWPAAELILIEDTGHGGGSTMSDTLVATTDRFGSTGITDSA